MAQKLWWYLCINVISRTLLSLDQLAKYLLPDWVLGGRRSGVEGGFSSYESIPLPPGSYVGENHFSSLNINTLLLAGSKKIIRLGLHTKYPTFHKTAKDAKQSFMRDHNSRFVRFPPNVHRFSLRIRLRNKLCPHNKMPQIC